LDWGNPSTTRLANHLQRLTVMKAISHLLPTKLKRSLYAPRFLEKLMRSQVVVGGLFKGMQYHGESVCSTSAPKIMGIYESELAPQFLNWSVIPFQRIIDVGAAEGYYAVGCAMLWPRASVTAFESTEEGRRLLTRMVGLNGLQSRVEIRGHCDQEQFRTAISVGNPMLIIMDVEGAERTLLDPERIPGLLQAYIIVEIHDCFDEGVGELVKSRLQTSHNIREIWTKPRTIWDFHKPSSFAMRLWLLPYLKQYASELRPCPMRWFCCAPKAHKLR
jgi:hypothetical protein